MFPCSRPFEHGFKARARLAAAAILTVGFAAAAGLAGCASEPASGPHHRSPTDAAPYVGVFTGEYVDGLPLYRFPRIEVVGSRSSLGPGT